MALLGLRITECVNINILDLDFQKNKIRIDTEKVGTVDYLYFHNEVRKLFFEWCEEFQDEILAREEYVGGAGSLGGWSVLYSHLGKDAISAGGF